MKWLYLSIALLSFSGCLSAQPVLPHSESELNKAIVVGNGYSSRADYQKRALSDKRIPLARAENQKIHAGTFKNGKKGSEPLSVTFYDDEDVLAAMVADGKSKLHTVTIEELRTIPKTGLLFATLNINGGPLWAQLFGQRYANGGAKIALDLNGKFIEPVRSDSFQMAPKTDCTETTYLWSVFGNYRFNAAAIIPITTSCDVRGPRQISLEFAFQPSQVPSGSLVKVVFGAQGSGVEYTSKPISIDALMRSTR